MQWTTDCVDTLDEAQCEVFKEGVDALFLNQETINTSVQNNGTILSTEFLKIDNNGLTIIDFQNSISAYLFFILVFSAVYIIVRWIFRLISDIALGW